MDYTLMRHQLIVIARLKDAAINQFRHHNLQFTKSVHILTAPELGALHYLTMVQGIGLHH